MHVKTKGSFVCERKNVNYLCKLKCDYDNFLKSEKQNKCLISFFAKGK